MKILITGANGLLGQHLSVRLASLGYTVVATGKGLSRLPFQQHAGLTYIEMDFTNDALVQQVMAAQKPDVVVHGGAMTQIDECEQNREACLEANVQGTAQMLLAAEQYSRHFIFLSTDFVFDGSVGNYAEDGHLNPVSWYGFTKVQAESTVETSEIPWAIVRTCLVYGNPLAGTRSNILSWVKASLEQGKAIKVVSDQLRTPTYVGDLVDGLITIIERKAEGIFHLAGKDRLSPYEMAIAVAKHLQLNKSLIEKVDASTFTQPAKRPPKTGLDITKAKTLLAYDPQPFEHNLELLWKKDQ
jgi:dTDP-4-dehydrorhamnose reductase